MKEKKIKEQRRKYDADFKQQVLQMIANGRPVREVAESLGIGENLIYRWRSRQESRVTEGKENASATTDQQALLRRIRELEMERDILKKALAIFSRQP
jgi:transposase